MSKRSFGKAWCFLTFSAAFILLLAFISGCKYDVAEPQWDQPFEQPLKSPSISSIEPNAAVPGVNTIKIVGENLDLIPNNWVYFDIEGVTSLKAEIIEQNSSSIICRRPNLITDSCIIKVVPDSGLVVKYGPYEIDQVMEAYGSYVEKSVALGALAADNAENIYVITGANPFPVTKVTPDGQKTVIKDSVASIATAPTDLLLGPGGYLYVIRGNRTIERVNPQTGEVSTWHRLSANRQIKFGAFDSEGYLYTGGNRTDLYTITPDSTSSATSLYASSSGDSIFAAHVYNGYLYLAVGTSSGNLITRHKLNGSGSLGDREVVTDMLQFAGNHINDFAVASDGKIYIALNSIAPLLVFDLQANTIDYFYKGIVPPYVKKIAWGNGNYIYIISGNTTPAQDWTVYRIDMGTTRLK